jgi:hypothetical protein
VTEFGERIYEEAYALGCANARVIELAGRHCLDMAFTEASGHGLAEQQSGLPMNARRISCPVAVDNTWGSNLEWLAEDFYNEHCPGCQLGRPTGEVLNLASVIGEREAAVTAARQDVLDAVGKMHQRWQPRGRILTCSHMLTTFRLWEASADIRSALTT